MRHAIPVLTGVLLTLAGAALMGAAIQHGAPGGAPHPLLLVGALSALPAGVCAAAASYRRIPWPLAVLLHVGSNPAVVLFGVAVAMTVSGLGLWFLIPGIGMAGGVLLMAGREVALAGLLYAVFGAVCVAAVRRFHGAQTPAA